MDDSPTLPGNHAEFDARRLSYASSYFSVILIFVFTLGVLVFLKGWPPPIWLQICTVIVFLLMVPYGIVIYAIVVTERPGIVISDSGILMRASFTQPIPWHEVGCVRLRPYGNAQKSLDVVSKDGGKFTASPTKLRVMIRWLFARPYSRELIDITWLEPPPDVLADAIERYVPVEDILGSSNNSETDFSDEGDAGGALKGTRRKRWILRALLWIGLVGAFMIIFKLRSHISD